MGAIGSTIDTLDFINAHDRTLICVGTDDSAVRIYDESTNRLLSSWIALYDENVHLHRSTPTSTAGFSSSAGKLVLDWNQDLCRIYASRTDLDSIALWDVECERRLYSMDTGASGGVQCLVSDANGYCAAGMSDGTVHCFDTRSRDSAVLVMSPSTPVNRYSPIIVLKADANARLLSISTLGQLRRWDIETGISSEPVVPQTTQNVLAADVHATANVLALATSNALQFKTSFGDLLFDIKHSKFAQVSCLSFHRYRQLFAVGFADGSLSMFTGKTNASSL